MQNVQAGNPLLRIVRNALLFVVVIFLLVGIVYLLAGWQTLHQYANGLVWAGGFGLVLLLASIGWRNGRREEQMALGQIMRDHDVFFLLNRDNDGRARYMLVGLIALGITLVIGLILL